jgi:hypothetical protein
VDRCFGELYHCKTQCNNVVQRLGVSDMFICGPLWYNSPKQRSTDKHVTHTQSLYYIITLSFTLV